MGKKEMNMITGDTHIQRKSLATISSLVPINSNQRLTKLKQSSLQTDNYKLHTRSSMVADIIGNSRDVGIIERRVYLVENEEWRWLVGMDGEEKGESSHCLLASGEMLHVSESLERGHGVVFDAVEVGFFGVFDVEISIVQGTVSRCCQAGRCMLLYIVN